MAATVTEPNLREQALRSLDALPYFSPALSRLLATLSNEDVFFAQISDLIERDVVLAGNILGLVNSGVHGRGEGVNCVRHAVSLLGVGKLRNAALSMSVTRMWNKPPMLPAMWASFNEHSLGTAMLADVISQEAPVIYPEGAFVAGLLHDLGRLLLAVALPSDYEEVERLFALGRQSRTECELQVLGLSHDDLSGEALETWHLPEPIRTAVRYHHTPEADPTPVKAGEYPLSMVIAAADQYASTGTVDGLKALNLGGRLGGMLEAFHGEFATVRTCA